MTHDTNAGNITDSARAARPEVSTYEAYLREVVKERDFVVLRPWQRARAEHEIVWKHRVVHAAARRYQWQAADVASDLERALAARTRVNRRRYAARLPALLAQALRGVRKRLARWVVLPALRLRYAGVVRAAETAPLPYAPSPRRGTGQPIASIVVLSHNRRAYLASTLAALQATTARDDYELIVVDNGSTDGSVELLRQLAGAGVIDTLVLHADNLGTSIGYNSGFARAAASVPYLVKLDSDILIVTPGWLRRFAAFYARVPDAGLLALKQINHVAHRLAPTERMGGERVISWKVSVAGGACMTIPRAVFDRLGYFRRDFGVIKYMPDDIDYAARVTLLGRRSFYLCDTLAYHRGDRDRAYAALERQKKAERVVSREQMTRIRQEYILGRDLYVPHPDPDACTGQAGQTAV